MMKRVVCSKGAETAVGKDGSVDGNDADGGSRRSIRVDSWQSTQLDFQTKTPVTSSPLLPISESKCGHQI